MQRFKKYAIGAGGMLVLVVAIVLATGSGSAVAAQITSVFVTNDAAHPVPVHERGTANVNLINSSLPPSGNRLIQLADHLNDPNDTYTTAWVDTHDCRRIVGYSFSSQWRYQLQLQVTADPSLGNGVEFATYQGSLLQSVDRVFDYTITRADSPNDPQPDSQPVVAPYSRFVIRLVGANLGLVDVSAYLYCVR